MKKKIAWITDSTCSLTPASAAEMNIHVLPVSILFGETSYKDGIDLSIEEFYDKLNESEQPPTTSQPTIGDSVALFEKLKEEYEMGIAVHVSSKLSGTINGTIMAAEMAGFPLIAIDSKTIAEGIVQIIKKGMELEQQGLTAEEIKEQLVDMTNQVKCYVLIGSLDQLRRGGRLSSAGFFLGNLLQVKPILTLEDGALVPFDKVRTLKKAEKRVLGLAEESIRNKNVVSICIVHSSSEEKVREWQNYLEANFEGLQVTMGDLSPSVGVHVGSDTIALLWFEE